MPFNKMVLLSQERYETLMQQLQNQPKNPSFSEQLETEIRSALNENSTKDDETKLRMYHNLMSRLLEQMHSRPAIVGPKEEVPVVPATQKEENEIPKIEEQNTPASDDEEAYEDANSQQDDEDQSLTVDQETENAATKRYMSELLKHCAKHANVFRKNGTEIVINGLAIPGSDVSKLMEDFSNPYRSRSDPCIGSQQFADALKDTGCPREAIGNKARRYRRARSQSGRGTFTIRRWHWMKN